MNGQQDRGHGQLIGGVTLIAIGALFLLDRFWVLDIGWVFSRFWPSVLIFIGVMQIMNGRARSWTGPVVLIAVGAIFQAQRLRLFDWHFRNLWPVVLIAIGVAMLTDRLRKLGSPQPLPPSAPAPSSGAPQEHPQT